MLPPEMRLQFKRLILGLISLMMHITPPDSMKAALDLLEQSGHGKRRVILGDMLELGDISERAHREIGGICCKENRYFYWGG